MTLEPEARCHDIKYRCVSQILTDTYPTNTGVICFSLPVSVAYTTGRRIQFIISKNYDASTGKKTTLAKLKNDLTISQLPTSCKVDRYLIER